MKYAAVAAFVAGVLLLVKYMMNRARTDQIVGRLQGVNDPKAQDEYEKASKDALKELEDAKIKFANQRRDLDQLLDQPSSVRNSSGSVPQDN